MKKHFIGTRAARIAAVALFAAGACAAGLPASAYAASGGAISQAPVQNDAVAGQESGTLVTSNASSYAISGTITSDLGVWGDYVSSIGGNVALSAGNSELNAAQKRSIDGYFGDSGQVMYGAIDIALDQYLSDGSDGTLDVSKHYFGLDDDIEASITVDLADSGLNIEDLDNVTVTFVAADGSRNNSLPVEHEKGSTVIEFSLCDELGTFVIGSKTDVPEPWDSTGEKLLPYTVKDGVMTFDGRPDLGEWYQLTVVANDGTIDPSVPGGAGLNWTMTIDACMLDKDDPLYNPEPDSGTYFIRGYGYGESTGLFVDYDHSQTLEYSLTSGNGLAELDEMNPIIHINLSSPAALEIGYKDAAENPSTDTSEEPSTGTTEEPGTDTSVDSVTVTNEQGASFTHEGSDTSWSDLSLVTEWLGGDIAKSAGNAVNAAVEGVTKMYVYDIHLEDIYGSEFKIPAGEKVTVTLPIPEGMSAEGLHVFHVAENGTVTDMDATVDAEARTATFTTTHFSTFVLATVGPDDAAGDEKPSSDANLTLPQTGDSTLGAVAAAAVIAIAGAGLIVAGKRVKR